MSTKARNNNLERERTRAKEEVANAVLRMRDACEDARRYLTEEGVFAEQLWILERAARNSRNASKALDWATEHLGQKPLQSFLDDEDVMRDDH